MVFEKFSERMQKLIEKKGFLEPTLPQKMGIPKISAGKNVLIIAPTGIGKTETAMLPLIDKIFVNQSKPIAMLYITPLRSLNRDLLDRLCWWADNLDLDISVRHGDTSQSERNAQREMPPHILITTPETLNAILTGKKMREHLKNVKHVVIDEIHELVESKRGVQLSLILERLREFSGNYQIVGLSATVGSPQLVADFLAKNIEIIRAETEKEYDIKVETPKPSAKDRALSEDLFIGLETTARLRRLRELIENHKSVLTFTNTRETAEVLSSRLRKLDKELKHAVHHGSLSKERRIKSEQDFKSQALKSIIATSSLELGIDIGSIDLVVQYLSPRQVTRLIQRVGRAGHGVGRVSKGIILSGDEDIFESTIIASNAREKKLEEIKIHDHALDVLANQIIGLAIDEYDILDEKIYHIVKRAYPFRNIKKDELKEIIQFLSAMRMLWLDESPSGIRLRRSKKAWQYYFDNLSTIPDTFSYRVVSIIEGEPIGNLDEAFVAEHGQSGNKFVFSGRAWKIIQIDGNKVIVEPVEDMESAIPAWEGELIPVPFKIAQDVGVLRRFISKNFEDKNLVNLLKVRYGVDSNSANEMIALVKSHKETNTVPDDKKFLIENYKDFIIIHSCCGSLVNATVGRYLSSIMTAETGVSVNMKTDPYRIMLQTTAKKEDVKRILENAKNIEAILKLSIERSSMFKWRFMHIARRFGIVSKRAKYEKINTNKIMMMYENSPAYKETLREVFLEKMDIEGAQDVLEKIKNEEIKIIIESGLSILGKNGLVQQFSEVMKPLMPEKEIFNAFRRRLLSTRVRILCTNCGEYNLIQSVRNVDKNPECPKCASRLLAVLPRNALDADKIVKKKLAKKLLNEEETKRWVTMKRSSDLVVIYGRKAVIVMAARGVGPQTAARILAMLHHKNEEFYKDILKAEKDFARTKVYWK